MAVSDLKSKNILIEIGIAFALYWICLALVYPFELLKSSPITYYLYLPAGIKLFTILIFRWRAVIGVALASSIRLIYSDPTQPWLAWIAVATAAALALYLVVEIVLRALKIDQDLSNLGYYQIVLLPALTSVVNGFVFSYGVSILTNANLSEDVFHRSFLAVIGNFAGNALFVCLMMLLIRHKLSIINFFKKNYS